MEAPGTESLAYKSFDEVESLVRGFESCALSRAEWTHHAHLTIACWYLLRHTRAAATALIRERIKRFNDAKGIVTTRESGYHETMTLFWIHLVYNFIHTTKATTHHLDLFNELIARCGDSRLPLTYYSRERLMSWEARASWVEPDLKALE